MKFSPITIALFAIVLLAAHSNGADTAKSVDESQLRERDGILYQVNDLNPYTGTVTAFYESGQKHTEANYIDGKEQGEIH